jgi:hypothetical protein
MALLIGLLDNDGLDSQNLILVLSTLDELLGHKSFESYLLHDQVMKNEKTGEGGTQTYYIEHETALDECDPDQVCRRGMGCQGRHD